MQYTNLGRSGLKISQLVLGCVSFGELVDPPMVDRIVGTAIDHGISTFDTGDAYAFGTSERLLGQALRRERHRVVICTKVGLRVGDGEADHASAFGTGYDHAERWKRGISPNDAGLGRAHIVAAVEDSLRRLGTDWIDLYQVHRWDNEVPIEETLDVLDDLVRAGKVRYIGCSQYAAQQLRAAAEVSRDLHLARFTATQVPYNMLNRGAETELMPTAEELGIGLMTFQTLAGGILTGRYNFAEGPEEGSRIANRATYRNRYWNAATFDFVQRLERLAHELGRRPEELALGWNLAQPGVKAILAGAEKPEDVIRNVAIAQRPLQSDELAQLQRLVR